MSVYIKMFLLGAVVLLASGVCAAQGPKPDAAAPRAAAGKRGYLGVALNGNQVLPVAPGSPAEKAGLESGDRITMIDGAKVAGRTDIAAAVGRKSAGDDLRAISAAGKFFYVAGGNGAVLRLLPE